MTNEDICNFIRFGAWLWDFISDVMDCNCKKTNN